MLSDEIKKLAARVYAPIAPGLYQTNKATPVKEFKSNAKGNTLLGNVRHNLDPEDLENDYIHKGLVLDIQGESDVRGKGYFVAALKDDVRYLIDFDDLQNLDKIEN